MLDNATGIFDARRWQATGFSCSWCPMLAPCPSSNRSRAGFTVLELATAFLIVLILIVLFFPIFSTIQTRVESTRCVANLKNLHVAADMYLQEHRTWPQIKISGSSEQDAAKAWISALQPYGIEAKAWVCPTSQRRLGNPDLGDPVNVRIDYLATPFAPGQQIPFKWTNQPWFAERFDEHGNGNLIIFPDGHVEAMFDVLKRLQKPPPGT